MSLSAADGNMVEAIQPAYSVGRAIATEHFQDEPQSNVPRAIAIAVLLSVPFWACFGLMLHRIW
jgi:hypothetical protein